MHKSLEFNMDHFVQHVGQPKVWKHGSSDKVTDDDWRGFPTIEESYDALRFGWPEGRKYMTDITGEMKASTSVEVQEIETKIRDIAGGVPDIAAAISGDPCHWERTESSMVSTRIVRVVVAADTSSGVSADQIMNRGGAILSYIDALENAGYRCEVVYYVDAKHGGDRLSVQVIIKQAEESLDIDRLAFCLVNPSMLRRFFFRCLELEPEFEHFYSSYGTPSCERPLDADLYFPFMGGCYDQSEAISYAEAIVDKELIKTA